MTFHDAGVNEKVLSFGHYLLFRSEKLLMDRGRPLRLGSHAIDLLIALVERAGEVVSKNDLISYAWPNSIVDDNNLRVHVAAIRKILGDGHGGSRYIINVAGRGYSFVAPVSSVDAVPSEYLAERAPTRSLPAPLTHVVGRDEAIESLLARRPRRRLLTIIGPGGVGKTTLAVAIAERLAADYQRLYFADLSMVEEPTLVPSALATVLGISTQADDPISNLILFLRDKHYLIVLDNCEHVIESATELVERILQAAPLVEIINTSREPLRARDEYLFNLLPLANPPVSPTLSVAEASTFPAIQLFVERAASGMESFELTDANVANVVSICRRIDGIPLAIELVAARVNVFGIDALSKDFDDDVILGTTDPKAVDSRHQSIRSTLDWSYKMLSPVEQVCLRRLAVFKGLFSAESAAAVVSGGSLAGDTRLVDLLMSLAAKSLLTTDVSGSAIRYRLLHVTRAYAAERLSENDERAELLRRHAQHLRALLDGANDDWDKMSRDQWLSQYGSLIDDARAAIDWAFSPLGSIELGAALTIATLPFGFQLSLIDETIRRATLALNALGRMSPPQPLSEIRLQNALTGLLSSTGASEDVILATTTRALTLAHATGITRYLVEPLANRGAVHSHNGNFVAAVQAAAELDGVAKSSEDTFAALIADRLGAQVYHLAGDHARSRMLIERVLRHPARAIPLSYGQIGVDRKVSMRIMLSRILWLEGYFDQASQLAGEAIDLAVSDGPMSICHALGLAGCPIAFFRGDLEAADKLTHALLDYSRRYNFNRWSSLGRCFERTLALFNTSADPEKAHIGQPEMIPEAVPFPEILPAISDYWADSLGAVRSERSLTGWAAPEVMRGSTAKRLRTGALQPAAAEVQYGASLAMAKNQKALAWELRTTHSLAQLWHNQGRKNDAYMMLRAVVDRFSEGRESQDLRAARRWLHDIQLSS